MEYHNFLEDEPDILEFSNMTLYLSNMNDVVTSIPTHYIRIEVFTDDVKNALKQIEKWAEEYNIKEYIISSYTTPITSRIINNKRYTILIYFENDSDAIMFKLSDVV